MTRRNAKTEKKLGGIEFTIQDVFLVWCAAMFGAGFSLALEGWQQYRTGLNIPEQWHAFIDPLVFGALFLFGSLMFTLIGMLVFRHVFLKVVRWLESTGVDSLY